MIGHRGLWALFCNFYCPSAKLQCTASIPRHCCYLYPQSYQFQPYCSPSSCLCLKYNSHYSPFPCSASAVLLLLTQLEERKIRYLFIIQKRKTQWYMIKRHQIWSEELLICWVSCKRSHQMIFHYYLRSLQSQILCSALSVWVCVCLSCTGYQCQHDNGKNTLREANSTACLSKAAMPSKRVARICCSCVWE